MHSETTMMAEQCRLQEWATQIRGCQNRPAGMSVVSHGITKVNYYYWLRRIREACLESMKEETSTQQIVPVQPGVLQHGLEECSAQLFNISKFCGMISGRV